MNRRQIENIYKANGLNDYKLTCTDDLLKVHGINFKVDGYNRLDDLNRRLYEKFIVNIFNAWGLESRATLIPKGIYFVEEISYAVKQEDSDGFLEVAGTVNIIDKNGIKTVLHSWEDEDYKHLEQAKTYSKTYLRFEYEHQGHDEWLHVLNEKEWY